MHVQMNNKELGSRDRVKIWKKVRSGWPENLTGNFSKGVSCSLDSQVKETASECVRRVSAQWDCVRCFPCERKKGTRHATNVTCPGRVTVVLAWCSTSCFSFFFSIPFSNLHVAAAASPRSAERDPCLGFYFQTIMPKDDHMVRTLRFSGRAQAAICSQIKLKHSFRRVFTANPKTFSRWKLCDSSKNFNSQTISDVSIFQVLKDTY